MPSLAESVQIFGYPALALGAFLEGESVLIAAGIAAHLGYLNLALVILIAAVFSFLGDQFVFWLGRRYGTRIVARWPRLAPGLARVRALIGRHPDKIVIGIRFMYGLRFAGLLALGMTPAIRARRFLVLNAIGACLWGLLGAGAGYLFGEAIQWMLADLRDDLREYRVLIIALVIAIAVVVKLYLMLRRPARVAAEPNREDPPPARRP